MNRTASRFGRAAAFALAGSLAIGMSGCAAPAPAPAPAEPGAEAPAEPYKVGLLLGLTGIYSGLGELQRQAIELYMNDVNEAGGINGREVELVVIDSTSDEANAVNQYRKLATEDEVDVVIGPSSSGESIALRPISGQMMTPVISLGASQNIVTPAAESAYMFKVFNDTTLAVQAQMEYIVDQGWEKIAVLSVNNGYGQDGAKNVAALAGEYGLELVAEEVFEGTATDVAPQLTTIAAEDPDVLLVWAVNPANAVVAKSAEAIEFQPVQFHSAGAGSPVFIETAGTAAEGVVLQGSKVLAFEQMSEDDPQYEVTADFVERFSAEYGFAPGQYESSAWDASGLLVAALEKIDPSITDLQETRDAIREVLENETVEFIGVNGIFTFTPEYHGQSGLDGLAALRVEDGRFIVEATY